MVQGIDPDDGVAIRSSFRLLAEIYHDLLSRDGVQLLERIAKTVRQLIPVTSLLIAETKLNEGVLVPLIAAGEWPEGFLEHRLPLGEGLIGVAAERGRPILSNEAHLDARAGHVAGTSIGDPEAIISVPLIARGVVIGAMSLYREGESGTFTEFEYEMAQHFADAAALALENAHVRQELRDLATRDELTGVRNRRGFTERMTEALRDTAHSALVVIDLNDFKAVNDSYGHPCGDELLRHVARLLQTEVRPSKDEVCRLGGDEFALILAETDIQDARVLCKRLGILLAENPLRHGDKTVEVAASFGVAACDPLRGVEDVLLQADEALYAAKDSPVRPLRLVRDTTA
jgi:diguanylate cyclase (GGDEF)-like protein